MVAAVKPNNTLGIVVNSNRYFNYVTHLADAALQDQKDVRVHLMGPGSAYIQTKDCKRLSKTVSITLCMTSARWFAREKLEKFNNIITLVHPGELSKILGNCTRYVVF